MPDNQSPDDFLEQIRELRSSEGNFEAICQLLTSATKAAEASGNTALSAALNETREKYAAAYEKARETSGTAWPEFEKFVTELERALTGASHSRQV
ncbi:hypothetical protein [Flavisolibacter nicotianae]|uniref:hypothetical protein n=1 Tax=Flavisolibacter nicotianae TaxID=2364882 RepID=UPI000EB22192|nr:hypothetical protein [Flavisolibacter nicotianae]